MKQSITLVQRLQVRKSFRGLLHYHCHLLQIKASIFADSLNAEFPVKGRLRKPNYLTHFSMAGSCVLGKEHEIIEDFID